MQSRFAFLLTSAGTLAAGSFAQAQFDERLREAYRHRQVFGAHHAADGSVFEHMRNSLNAYEFDLGEGPGTLHAAAILYGTAVALGLDDATWKRFRLAEVQKARGDAAREGDGNPYLHPARAFDPSVARSDPRHPSNDASLEALVRRGAAVAVCNNALTSLATFVATGGFGNEGDPGSALAALAAGIVGGAFRVPAGVAALNAAQEARFTYCAVS